MAVPKAEGKALYGTGWFAPDAIEVAFPLGGIGTGNISLGARGDLRDFEIWNEPRKGLVLPYTHFTLRTAAGNNRAVTRVLEGRIPPPYAGSHGIHANHGGGLPRFAESRFRGQYPVAELELSDPDVPVQAGLMAFTPFVALDPDESGLPCAVFQWTLTNTSDEDVTATIVGSLLNPAAFSGFDEFGNLRSNSGSGGGNRWREEAGARGVFFEGRDAADTALSYGNAALVSTAEHLTAKPEWFRGGWYDTLREFWDDLSSDGLLDDLGANIAVERGVVGPQVASVVSGSVGAPLALRPGASATVTFILAWYFPNRVNGWDLAAEDRPQTTRVRYAQRFDSAWDVASYAVTHLEELREATVAFRDALFDSTLPPAVIDAVAGTMVVARSNTCFWLENGRFYGWEGCFDHGGSCHGNCTHVWAYTHTLAFLFPELEMSMLRTAFLDEVEESGKMHFRAASHFGQVFVGHPAAADGQLGSIIRLWRTYLLTGDRDFLRELWPNARRCMDYATATWDTDGDGLPDGEQHNTYDIEFWGPNPLTSVLFLGAVRAMEELAMRLGRRGEAEHYHSLFTRCQSRVEELLWSGEYYSQNLTDIDRYPYQHGSGCLSDQLLGQLLAHVAHLGHLLPSERVRTALDSIVKYNFLQPLGNHVNLQRTYAFHDEDGLVLCSWPKGGRPKLPFVYSDEVWTGVEYHVAAHLIYEGSVETGLRLVSAVRARHDGYRRNPWNEVECGHHYARSMASWALVTALSGFSCDVEQQILRFHPADANTAFRALFTCGAGWGIYSQEPGVNANMIPLLRVVAGNLDGFTVEAGDATYEIASGQLRPAGIGTAHT